MLLLTEFVCFESFAKEQEPVEAYTAFAIKRSKATEIDSNQT